MTSTPMPLLRLTMRAANAFILDLLKVARGDRDFMDALILATLVQSNSAPLAGDPDLQQRFALIDAPPPVEIRRPISINAIAASLGAPFETVRRRIKRLTAEGVCEAVPGGIRFRDKTLRSSEHLRALEDTYATVRRLYERLSRAGCLAQMGLPEHSLAGWSHESPPVRIVWRMASDYLLRMMEHLAPNFPSLTRAFILLAVVRANTDAISDAVRGDDGVSPADFVPDSRRKPARASDVAALLGLPHETVRRNLLALLEEGRCIRVHDGFVVPAAVLARPNVLAATGANYRYLARMFAELAELGVLALWDAEVQGPLAVEARAAASPPQFFLTNSARSTSPLIPS